MVVEMTEDRCRALVSEAAHLVNSAHLASTRRTPAKRLQRLARARALLLEVVQWPPHQFVQFNSGVPFDKVMIISQFNQTLHTYAKMFIEVYGRSKPSQCRAVVRRSLLRIKRYEIQREGPRVLGLPASFLEALFEELEAEIDFIEKKFESALSRYERVLEIYRTMDEMTSIEQMQVRVKCNRATAEYFIRWSDVLQRRVAMNDITTVSTSLCWLPATCLRRRMVFGMRAFYCMRHTSLIFVPRRNRCYPRIPSLGRRDQSRISHRDPDVFEQNGIHRCKKRGHLRQRIPGAGESVCSCK